LPSRGSVIARVYTSDAYIPLEGAQVVFSSVDEAGSRRLLALRLTNSSGLTDPVYVETPDFSESLKPDAALQPYATIEISTSLPGYSRIVAQQVQVFPNIETIQDLQLQPVSDTEQNRSETYRGNRQNL